MTKVPIQDFSDEELCQRMYNLALNFHYYDQTLTLHADVAKHYEETADECRKRHLDRAFVVPEHTQIGDHPPIFHPSAIIRYDKRPNLENLMQGIVSFGPSKLYGDAPNHSQKDDETRRGFRQPNQVLTISGVQYPASKIILYGGIAEIDGRPIDYHLFCTSYEESLKLSRAFDADGFVKIRDHEEFLCLIRAELKRVCPEADIFCEPVRYYDDRADRPPRQLDEMILHKTIDYKYQREVRFAVLDWKEPGNRFQIQIQPPDGLFELRLY